ncbi:MAG: hypothetical protein NUV56_03335 [Candidatus Uhrbacteria bacterium]|nr:hypothetical protein [Candidatus Uhrbacteria bacterium]
MVGGLRNRVSGSGRRLNALRFFFLGFCGVIVIRLFILQVANASFYTALAEGQYSLYEELVPERGEILVKDFGDDTEYAAATDEPRALVYADPSKIEDPKGVAIRIARALGMEGIEEYEHKNVIAELAAAGKTDEVAALLAIDAMKSGCAIETEVPVEGEIAAETAPAEPCVADEEGSNDVELLAARLAKPNRAWELVMRNVAHDALDRLLALEIEGIGYLMEDARTYPEKGMGGHVFGFVGRDANAKPIGQYGLEGYFNDFLAGTPGSLYSQADGAGRWIGVGERSFSPAVDGGDLLLTLDRTVQYTACGLLRDAVAQFDADGGALVIVEPETGAVIAMCGAPDFDPKTYYVV